MRTLVPSVGLISTQFVVSPLNPTETQKVLLIKKKVLVGLGTLQNP